MITKVETFLRRVRRTLSRSQWTIRLLRLPQLKERVEQPGLVMAQIDGLSRTQFERALNRGNLPFLQSLISKEKYKVHTLYSGLPSNTPAVQGELFYGIKGCVPAFCFMDKKLGQSIRMFDVPYVVQFEPGLRAQTDRCLLSGGSSYSNLYAGGAQESHFCWSKMGWDGILHATHPLVLPFLIILYADIFVRTALLFIIEFFLAVFDCIRGTLKGRLFFRELEMLYLRTLVCVVLRDFIVAGVCMDIMRGLPIIHMNFLGYDEQAHCRGPGSRFAHWSLQGIDDAIRRIHHVMEQSPHRTYDLWVYADHGQEKTTPYFVKYGITFEQAVERLFKLTEVPVYVSTRANRESTRRRATLLNRAGAKQPVDTKAAANIVKEVTVCAMGPLGHIYVHKSLTLAEIEFYAQKLVSEVKIPLVMTKDEAGEVTAWTRRGKFSLPQQADLVFGYDHPFLEEIRHDILRVCRHTDAGHFIISGWCAGEEAISFPLEYGAHASMGPEETRAFALLPMDAPVHLHKPYMRALDLREAALRFLNREQIKPMARRGDEQGRQLRLISYNTHGCMGLDGRLSVDRIARVLARYDPDVVCLQELDVGRTRSAGIDQIGNIARILDMEYKFHPVSRHQGEYGNAILSRYPLTVVKMDALPRKGEQARYETRGVLWACIEFQGTKVQIFNTHLSLWPQERLLQVKSLLESDWLSHPDCVGPSIICGDFNASRGSPTYRKICEKLKDSQAALEGHRPRRTYYGRYPLTCIDHVFVSTEFKVTSVLVPRTNLDKIASDHLPLIVDLAIAEVPVLTGGGYETKINIQA
jgi:endonuclease/exonuclease/phosphatase family metal-dependent hydrolase